LLTVLLIAGGIYFYFSTGRAPMATKAPPMPFESKLAKLGLHAYLEKLPHPDPQVPANEENLLHGAKNLQGKLRLLSWTPRRGKVAAAKGMYPPPPQLFMEWGWTTTKRGILIGRWRTAFRMSGMPDSKAH